jgi:hypothetical protein
MPTGAILIGVWFLLGALCYWLLCCARVPAAGAFPITFAIGVLVGLLVSGGHL